MLVVGIDENQVELSGPRNLFDIAGILAGMHPNPARQVRDKLRNLEADRLRLIRKAVLAQIDRVHEHGARFRLLVLSSGISNHGRRETAKRADLYHPFRREDVDESMKKQQVGHSYRSGAVALECEQMFQAARLR